ncbi:hypothetical protein QBC45DRAFT_489480 [Copromyces sp. CBS 386.78]|nr:hypothetical protein QBC45DRAFT_489480 [Copromyces sp. CBS 386.78]
MFKLYVKKLMSGRDSKHRSLFDSKSILNPSSTTSADARPEQPLVDTKSIASSESFPPGGHSEGCGLRFSSRRETREGLPMENKNRSPVQSKLPKTASQALEILSPVVLEVIDFHRLSQFLKANILFQTQDVTVVREDAKEHLIRWTFCSSRAQVEAARQALLKKWPSLHIR